MFVISFDLYCGTVNSRGKKKTTNKQTNTLPELYALTLATQDDTILKYTHFLNLFIFYLSNSQETVNL